MPRLAPSPTSARVGADKERLAGDYLQAQGLELVTRNYRCRRGEIDLVMRERGVLVFVEVRFRRSDRYGGAAATVDAHKQRRLAAAAAHYLGQHPNPLPCRFDVLALGGGDRIDWIKDAFYVE